MFPVFPVLFPVCSQPWRNEFFMFPVFWISSLDTRGHNGHIWLYLQPIRNTGNTRNTPETSRFGLGSHVEQTWNTGNSF